MCATDSNSEESGVSLSTTRVVILVHVVRKTVNEAAPAAVCDGQMDVVRTKRSVKTVFQTASIDAQGVEANRTVLSAIRFVTGNTARNDRCTAFLFASLFDPC